jgi:hypothetical protein
MSYQLECNFGVRIARDRTLLDVRAVPSDLFKTSILMNKKENEF